MAEYAKVSDFERLTEIWQESFGDTREYIENFLAEHKDRIKIPVLKIDDEIRSVMYVLPARMGEEMSYIYGVATPVIHRNKGYSSALLREVDAHNNNTKFLVPASKELEKMYEKAGYAVFQNEMRITVSKEAGNILIKGIDGAEYFRKREQWFDWMEENGNTPIRWGLEEIVYIAETVKKEQGFCIEFSYEHESGIIQGCAMGVINREANHALFIEMFDMKAAPADMEIKKAALEGLVDSLGCESGECIICPTAMWKKEASEQGKAGGFENSKPYFNLHMG